MSKVVLDMSMSVDGFITGPDDGPDHGLGVNGEGLHAWLGAGGAGPSSYRPADEPGATVFDEMMATGAVITGRRTFEIAGGWDGDHHDGVPIFVLTHAAPDGPAPGSVRYVTDGIESCVGQAKAAAGGRDIMMHGAATRAGVPSRRPAGRDGAARRPGASRAGSPAVRGHAARAHRARAGPCPGRPRSAAPALPRGPPVPRWMITSAGRSKECVTRTCSSARGRDSPTA